MHELCRVMGLSGKPVGIDGGDVEKYFREGRIQEIAEYCESDVVNTYRVWLRHELFRGKLTDAAFPSQRSQFGGIHQSAERYEATLGRIDAMRDSVIASLSGKLFFGNACVY